MNTLACILAVCLSTAAALTCVNKQTAISGGYKSTTNQGGASCTANKWCMKITATTSTGGQSESMRYSRDSIDCSINGHQLKVC